MSEGHCGGVLIVRKTKGGRNGTRGSWKNQYLLSTCTVSESCSPDHLRFTLDVGAHTCHFLVPDEGDVLYVCIPQGGSVHLPCSCSSTTTETHAHLYIYMRREVIGGRVMS